MNSPANRPIREWLMQHSNLISAIRLPNNLMAENAGTEVGTDLIVLQKNTTKTELSPTEQEFIETEVIEGINVNKLFAEEQSHVLFDEYKLDRDLYGNPALVYEFRGSTDSFAEKFETILGTDLKNNFNQKLQWDNLFREMAEKKEKARMSHADVIADPGSAPAVAVPHNIAPSPQEAAPLATTISSVSALPTRASLYEVGDDAVPDLRQRNKRGRKRKDVQIHRQADLFSQPDLFSNLPDTETLSGAQHGPTALQQSEVPFHADLFTTKKGPEPEVGSIINTDPRDFTGKILPYYKEGTIVIDGALVGYLKDLNRRVATFTPLALPLGQVERLKMYIPLRDAYETLYDTERDTEREQPELRQDLNECYDRFVSVFGDLHTRANAKVILMDSDAAAVLALERFTDGKKGKADIFSRPVSFNPDELKHVDTANEALAASLNKFCDVDLDYMSRLSDLTPDDLIQQLQGQIYYDPLQQKYDISERFLAGDVLEKAESVEHYLAEHPNDEAANVSLTALRDVAPRPIPFDEIDFNLGERWLPTGMFKQYARFLFNADVEVTYSLRIDQFSVSCNRPITPQITDQYCIRGKSKSYNGIALFQHALHNTTPDITKTIYVDGEEVKVKDAEAIQLATSKINEIRDKFSEWLSSQSFEFRERLASIYNRKFNCYVRPHYDGSHQTFPGLNLRNAGVEKLYECQKNAVWMLKLNGGGVCDHEVGTGKTLTMCIAAHEMKRLNLAHKPMIIALKANVFEIAETYKLLYPNAKVLFPGKNDFSKKNRVRIFNDIKNNDWDVVILTHDQFGMIPQSPEIQQQIYQAELDDIEENLKVVEQSGQQITG